MSTPLYYVKVLKKRGSIIELLLTITHPDVSDFGADRVFAWELLAPWVAVEDEDNDPRALAERHIRRVEQAKLAHAKVVKRTAKAIFVERHSEESEPSLVYTIEVFDRELLGGISLGDDDDVYTKPTSEHGVRRSATPISGDWRSLPGQPVCSIWGCRSVRWHLKPFEHARSKSSPSGVRWPATSEPAF